VILLARSGVTSGVLQGPEVFVGGPPYWVAFVAIASIVVGGIVLYPLARALARRLEGKAGDESLRSELEQLHERVAGLERGEERLLELENRIEFSERLLSRQGGDARPGPG